MNMRNGCASYEVNKTTLNQAQMNQIKLLINNLQSIQKKKLGYFSSSMVIEENKDSFIFSFEDITELQQCNNFQELFGVSNENFNDIIPYIIMRLIKLVIKFSKLGIHLPMLSNQHFIDTSEPSIWIEQDKENIMNSLQTKRIYLSTFGTDELRKDNQKLIQNLNIPNEIIEQIINGNKEQIKFNEKMTVFSLGCIIYELYTKNSIFQTQNQQELDERDNILSQDEILDIKLKQLIENCTKENPKERPTLIQLRQEYFTQLLKEKILDLQRFKIYQLTKYLIAPNVLITGRFCIMEFFAKIKFIKLFFNKNSSKDAKNQSDTIILILINQELDKLKLDLNQELILWDEDNTKDEINEFKKYFLNNYLQILENFIDKIMKQKQKDQTIIQLPNKNYEVLYNNIIREIIGQLKNLNEKSSQLNCLRHLNTIFKYGHLLEYFKPIQQKLIKTKPYHRYDTILEILFNDNNQQILDLERIEKIKQKI